MTDLPSTVKTDPPLINKEQLLSGVRYVVGIGTTWAIGKGYISQDEATQILAMAIPAAMLVWGIWAKRNSAAVANVAEMPNVAKVVMTTQAAAAAQPSPKVTAQ